jgi:Ni,Fe-hydrogenase I small subunit
MMGVRVTDYSENIRDDVESVAQALRYVFGVDRCSNTPFITTAYPEDSTDTPVKVEPKPSSLFGYVDLD